MILLFTIIIVIGFVLVIAYLLLEQKTSRINFYEDLHNEDKEEINKILNEDKFKIVDELD